MKILSIGNSFSIDTMSYIPDIARSAGVTNIYFGNLFIPGCSIARHYRNATEDLSEYIFYTNDGSGWEKTPEVSIRQALLQQWDIISIQHGTGDGSCYTKPESYQHLEALIAYVKKLAIGTPRIAFNMAWVAEQNCGRREITTFGGDQMRMYEALTDLTSRLVAPQVDVLSPAGTAIQNARTVFEEKLTRDDFHLSLGMGRYIAGLTFMAALTGLDLDRVTFAPEGVTEEAQQMAKQAVVAALAQPFKQTVLIRKSPEQ